RHMGNTELRKRLCRERTRGGTDVRTGLSPDADRPLGRSNQKIRVQGDSAQNDLVQNGWARTNRETSRLQALPARSQSVRQNHAM
ncbi:MAG TPA: hypothetical protein VN684_07275, partial [Terriglobales bacterium]|nr:hypothetical protein [Terriglobales bacterium]